MNVYVMVGFPASGKSTKAKQLSGEVLSSDAIRAELYGSEEEQGNPKEVFDTLYHRMETLLAMRKSVVVDSTNINRWERSRAIELAKKWNARNIVCINMNTPISECKKRNQARERKVPDFVFERMLQKYESPSYDEGFNLIL